MVAVSIHETTIGRGVLVNPCKQLCQRADRARVNLQALIGKTTQRTQT